MTVVVSFCRFAFVRLLGAALFLLTITAPMHTVLGASAAEPAAEPLKAGTSFTTNDVAQFQNIVTRIKQANRISASDYTQLEFVKDDTLNAATDGQRIMFTTGLWNALSSDDERAFVIAHEMAHGQAGHVRKTQLRQAGLSLVDRYVFGRFITANSVADKVENAGLSLLELRFSRQQEYQADDLGLRMMAKAGYNPRAAMGVFDTLEKSSGGSSPQLLRSHPLSKNRIDRLSRNYRL